MEHKLYACIIHTTQVRYCEIGNLFVFVAGSSAFW